MPEQAEGEAALRNRTLRRWIVLTVSAFIIAVMSSALSIWFVRHHDSSRINEARDAAIRHCRAAVVQKFVKAKTGDVDFADIVIVGVDGNGWETASVEGTGRMRFASPATEIQYGCTLQFYDSADESWSAMTATFSDEHVAR